MQARTLGGAGTSSDVVRHDDAARSGTSGVSPLLSVILDSCDKALYVVGDVGVSALKDDDSADLGLYDGPVSGSSVLIGGGDVHPGALDMPRIFIRPSAFSAGYPPLWPRRSGLKGGRLPVTDVTSGDMVV